jgi:hypothetical protein
MKLQIAGASFALVLAMGVAAPRAQDDAGARRQAFDEILDVDVRDGFVYYGALKAERGRLDGYVNSLAAVPIDQAAREEQIAFWLNAYNALVLQTVVEHYPIVQRSRDYPARSIRQIPGAFERLTHRVADRTVTLDQIEQTVLPAFHDPRVFLALGRGAVGSGRLRSEAFTGARLEQQLAEAASECLSHVQCVDVDRAAGTLKASSIFSWREKDFAAAYADKAPAEFGARSPIERLAAEHEFLARNTFRLEYIPFDWTLNDLTGRGR